uniref:Uncharacterized protein n=1 Tax=Romanomermis culicivorax TaxID=13658 RepID=A0A915JR21_ROMCU
MHTVKLFDHFFGSSTSIKNGTIAVPCTSRSIDIFTTTDQIRPDLSKNGNYNDSSLKDKKNVSLNFDEFRLNPWQPNFRCRLNMRLPLFKKSDDSGVEVDNDGGKKLSNTTSPNHYNFISAKQKISNKAPSSSYSCNFSRNLSTEESCKTSNSTRASYYSFLLDSGKKSIRKTISNYVLGRKLKTTCYVLQLQSPLELHSKRSPPDMKLTSNFDGDKFYIPFSHHKNDTPTASFFIVIGTKCVNIRSHLTDIMN